MVETSILMMAIMLPVGIFIVCAKLDRIAEALEAEVDDD
jgi:hypothetical protein